MSGEEAGRIAGGGPVRWIESLNWDPCALGTIYEKVKHVEMISTEYWTKSHSTPDVKKNGRRGTYLPSPSTNCPLTPNSSGTFCCEFSKSYSRGCAINAYKSMNDQSSVDGSAVDDDHDNALPRFHHVSVRLSVCLCVSLSTFLSLVWPCFHAGICLLPERVCYTH